MPIRFRCPDCGTKLSIDSHKSGEEIDCPDCGQPIIVPKPLRHPKMGVLIDDENDNSQTEQPDDDDGDKSPRKRRANTAASRDPMFAVRLVLLLAAIFSFFFFSRYLSFGLFLAWLLVGLWPRKK